MPTHRTVTERRRCRSIPTYCHWTVDDQTLVGDLADSLRKIAHVWVWL